MLLLILLLLLLVQPLVAALLPVLLAGLFAFAFSLVQSCMQLGFATGPLLGAVVARCGAGPGTDFRLVYVTAGLCCIAAGLGMVWLRRVSPVQAGP